MRGTGAAKVDKAESINVPVCIVLTSGLELKCFNVSEDLNFLEEGTCGSDFIGRERVPGGLHNPGQEAVLMCESPAICFCWAKRLINTQLPDYPDNHHHTNTFGCLHTAFTETSICLLDSLFILQPP